MEYVITDGYVFLQQDTSKANEPFLWKSKEAAENFLYALLISKKKKDSVTHFEVLPFEEPFLESTSEIENLDSLSLLKEAETLVQNLSKRAIHLRNQLSKTDKEINDLIHYIEFSSNQNVVNGYKLYKKLKDLRLTRRKIKDELLVIEYPLNNGINETSYFFATKRIETFKNRTYTPRTDGDVSKLFEEKGYS